MKMAKERGWLIILPCAGPCGARAGRTRTDSARGANAGHNLHLICAWAAKCWSWAEDGRDLSSARTCAGGVGRAGVIVQELAK